MSQPTLRCPNCGQSVPLPAETCPCGFDFRAGAMPKPAASDSAASSASSGSSANSTKIHLIIGGAAILILLALMGVFLLRAPTPPPPRPAPVASESPLLNPQVPIGRAQDAAALANENVQRLKDTQAEIDAEKAN